MNTRHANIDGEHMNSYTPMPQINLPKGISRNEMLEMRASGMSNTGIAKSIECPKWKVDKLIGKTPKSVQDAILAEARAKKKPLQANGKEGKLLLAASKPSSNDKSSGMRKMILHMIITGDIAEYHLGGKQVGIHVGDNCIEITVENLEAFIGELFEVMDEAINLERCCPHGEPLLERRQSHELTKP